MLHIFKTSAEKNGITLKKNNDVKYDDDFIEQLRDNLEDARNSNQQADINLQTVFEKVASEYKFIPDTKERHAYFEELINWLEAESK